MCCCEAGSHIGESLLRGRSFAADDHTLSRQSMGTVIRMGGMVSGHMLTVTIPGVDEGDLAGTR